MELMVVGLGEQVDGGRDQMMGSREDKRERKIDEMMVKHIYVFMDCKNNY